ncbi:MAG TPA: tetratricopeptide repeat protein [bacterium]|nr:tetratricopeptide repeat protein [bacterium]
MGKSPDYYPIVFTDLVASKLAMSYLPEYMVNEFLREHSRVVLDTARRTCGMDELPFKPTNLGDGNLFIFNNMDESIIFSICIMSSWKRYWDETVSTCLLDYPKIAERGCVLMMRIGIHYGLIYHEDIQDFSTQVNLGNAINTTFVLQGQASPGEVTITETAASLTASSLFNIRYRGRFDPLNRSEDVSEEERLSFYEVTGMIKPPRYSSIANRLPPVKRDRIALDWYWRGFYQGNDPTTINEAINSYEQATLFNPRLANAWANMGVHLSDSGKYDTAKKILEKALEMEPTNVNILCNLGSVFQKIGEPEEAKKRCEKALELDETSEYAHYNLGTVYLDMHELKSAEKRFQQAIELNPLFYQALYNLGCVHTLQERPEKALEYLSRAFQVYPQYMKIARKDEDLKSLWTDKRFLNLVGGTNVD